MRLKQIHIDRYKNLIDFDCTFSESNISAFIGNNGSGKSNLLEVITRAFGNAKNYAAGKDLPFSLQPLLNCVIQYEIDGIEYELQYNTDVDSILSRITADPPIPNRDEITILCNGAELSKSAIDDALPESILLYYAGETLRLKGEAENTYDNYYEEKLKRAKSAVLPSLCFMDYYSIGDLPLLLLTAAAYKGEYYSKFLEFVNCSDVTSKFSFVLKKPEKIKGNGNADTYWNATGFVKCFLDSARKIVSGTRDSNGKQYYMFFNNPEDFRKISENEYDLFAKLKALRHYGYLEHIGIELMKKDGNTFSSLRLSEGEKQLGLLMLLASFTSQHECLYLFDEFDAYLHLNWQRNFSGILNEIGVNGHILFTTHSPATISEVLSHELYLMKDGEVIYPSNETYKRALNEIMEEQMDISMRSPEVDTLYDKFKQSVADENKQLAEKYASELASILDESDPMLIKLRLILRRMSR